MPKPFQPKLAPTDLPWAFTPPASAKYGLDKLTLPVFLVLGSAAQYLLSLVLPTRWAAVPLLIYLATTLLSILLNQPPSSRSSSPAFPQNVVPGRAAAQLPLPDGTFPPSSSASSPVVVFHIGAQFNHPLGPLCPGARQTGDYFTAMHDEIVRRRDELGLLSSDAWTATVDGSFTTLVTMYFRDVESVHRFAHEDLHRRAWDWFAAQRFPHIGVYHETFAVPRRGYECVYLNCKPLLMGNAATRVSMGDKGGHKWVNSLVSADTPALKTQYARMGRDKNGVVVE